VGRYRIQYKSSVQKDLLAISTKKDRQRIVHRIESLSDDPRPPTSQKLGGTDLYRVRQGDFRILYEIHDLELVVIIVRIGDRSDVYRGL